MTPQPPPGKGRDPKVIVGLVVAAVLVAVAVVGVVLLLRSDSTATHTPADAEQSLVDAGAPEAGESGVGVEVSDGNFSFVVDGVQRAEAVADPEFPDLKKVAAGEYVIVNMTVTNVGSEPQTFFASFHTLSDGVRTYESDDEAWIYLGNTLADLNPGDSIRTAVVFDVPDGTQPESIELHDGPFSDGVTVAL